jgi:hypothetical protein
MQFLRRGSVKIGGVSVKIRATARIKTALISMTGHLTLSLADESGAKKLDLQLIPSGLFTEMIHKNLRKKTFDYDREKNKFDQLPQSILPGRKMQPE